MKLFGKKDKTAPVASDDLPGDDLGEMDAGLDEMEGAAAPAQPLSAPSRSLSGAAGGGRKNLVILALLLAVVAIGGGYFWFMGETGNEPIHVTAQTQTPVPPADMAAVPAPDAAAPAPDALAAAQTPANPADPFAAPAADPAAPVAPAAPADPAAAAAASTDPLAASSVPADPAAPATDPAVASTDPATAAADSAAAILGQPPADEATALAAIPGAGNPADMPDDQMPDMPAAATAPATPDGMPPQPAADPAADPAIAAGTTPVEPAPGEAAPVWAAPGTATVPGTTNPAATATSPNEAELAIVQHADVIDQLSRPAGTPNAAPAPAGTGAPFDPASGGDANAAAMKSVDDILSQQTTVKAVVRPIPSGYMTIRRESDAGSVDSRLKSARVALAQGNNAAALELFDDLYRDYPKDKRILMGRAVSLHKLGQADEALAAYEAVLNRDPKNIDALNNMLGLLKAKDPQLAVEKLEELHNAYPYQGDIAAQLGISYATTGQYDQALRYLGLADSLKPGSAFVLYNKSVLLDKMGRTREAATLYRQILRLAADGDIDQNLPLESIRRRLAALQ
ncbi:MAG: tetratricopeptide repeat family protein [Alphaproteobacteria bacterium]|jgi:Flp pilus assembly protein TadD|nr:tetratricopeptide repeat family protein [Alphaproteobacteria bacterium]